MGLSAKNSVMMTYEEYERRVFETARIYSKDIIDVSDDEDAYDNAVWFVDNYIENCIPLKNHYLKLLDSIKTIK